ncbi:MAG TPA: hypothetical protein DDZ51_13320 [Planctomycetaceae bacterium]|jgi:hypothetical protein|nr:hypothetical protein [Planctomycetaceae bacterium]
MFFVDDVLMSPFKGFMFLAREVANAVDKEREDRKTNLMSDLTALHKMLESGEISDDDFDDREADILDLLERLESGD